MAVKLELKEAESQEAAGSSQASQQEAPAAAASQLQPVEALQTAASQCEQQVLSHGVKIMPGIMALRAEDVFSHYLCLRLFKKVILSIIKLEYFVVQPAIICFLS